jgi:olfactory receptor
MLGSYLMAFCDAMAHTRFMLKHDILLLLQHSCTSTYVNELLVFIVVDINVVLSILTISISYGFFPSTFLIIKSSEGSTLLFLCSLVQVYLCVLNHLLLGLRMKEKSLLSFILL